MAKSPQIQEFQRWIKELVPDSSKIQVKYDNITSFREEYMIYLYTNERKYAIVAVAYSDNDIGYLGCVYSNRMAWPGEEHTRGADLPDGPLTLETWNKIVAAILDCELKHIATLSSSQPDVVES